MALTDKQARFVQEYMIDSNGTQAAIRAGYSPKTAEQLAHQLLKNPSVCEALAIERQKLAKKHDITHERILREYSRIGFADIRKAVKWRSEILTEAVDPDTGEAAGVYRNTVALVDSAELDNDTALAISEVKMDSRGGLSIKLHDKKAALDSMAKHLGMFEGKKGAEDSDAPTVSDDLRSAARDIAFLLRRGVQLVSQPEDTDLRG